MKKIVKAISRILHTSATKTSNHGIMGLKRLNIHHERAATMYSTDLNGVLFQHSTVS